MNRLLLIPCVLVLTGLAGGCASSAPAGGKSA